MSDLVDNLQWASLCLAMLGPVYIVARALGFKTFCRDILHILPSDPKERERP